MSGVESLRAEKAEAKLEEANAELMRFVSWLEDHRLLLGNWSIMWKTWKKARP